MNNRFAKTAAGLLVLLLVAIPAYACMWDYDTLAMERVNFPNALELIVGKFLRHSEAFYEWRIEDRKKKLEKDPNDIPAYDDLAVAYDKTGQHDKAIETILAKDKIKPGLYETEANLGTFYIHSGQLEKGLEHIERAIKINPDAHFGREIYQKYLVNYVLSKQQDGKTKLPLGDINGSRYGVWGFGEFVLEARKTAKSKGELSKEERNAELGKALKGVMGMMRFGHYDSPVLLEALGDLLLSEGIRSNDAKRLATRAYIKAARETADESVKADYMSLASHSLSMQTVSASDSSQLEIGALDAELTRDLAEADAWFQTVRADELMWIKANKDVDQEFSLKYYQDPQMSSSVPPWPNILIWAAFGGPALMVSLVLLALWTRRKRGAGPQTVPA